MSVVEQLGTWVERLVTAWRAVPVGMFWRGYWETPARWHKNWFTYFYFLPALPGCLGLWLYPSATRPLPSLEQATVYEGTASIWRQPSRSRETIVLKLLTGETIMFGCRDGAILSHSCSMKDSHQKKYDGKPARVWGAPVPKGFASPSYVAVQIEIDGEVVHPYIWSMERFKGGWLYSNENITSIAGTFFIYCLVVLFGFPYLNYRHWLSTQQANVAPGDD